MNVMHSFFDKLAMRFQISSDLHLEVGSQYSSYDIPAKAPYLILAGDIGRLKDFTDYTLFLQRLSATFKIIFLTLGNHEFYGLSHAAGLTKARELVTQDCLCGKVVLLDQTRCYFYFSKANAASLTATRDDLTKSNVTVLGCTLWSSIPDADEAIVTAKINDFRRIDTWSVTTHNAAHNSDLAWLQSQLSAIRDSQTRSKRQVVVITHYPPQKLLTSRPEHADNPWSSAFATNLLDSYDWSGVKLWVYGHTHYSNDFKTKGIRLVSNQRGYVLNPGATDEKIDRHDPCKIVRLWTHS